MTVFPIQLPLRRWPAGIGGRLPPLPRRIDLWICLRPSVKVACDHLSVGGGGLQQLLMPADGGDSTAFQERDAISVV